MKFDVYEHRSGLAVAGTPSLSDDWELFKSVIEGISEEEIIAQFELEEKEREIRGSRRQKSISDSLNFIINKKLVNCGWIPQPKIFGDKDFSENRWALDFAKLNDDGRGTFAVEVAFNHAGDFAWVLIKPVLSSELNNINKAIQTHAGIVITATSAMKKAGNFDGAIGTYESAQQYIRAMHGIITVPILLVGLRAPEKFKVVPVKKGRITEGKIVRL